MYGPRPVGISDSDISKFCAALAELEQYLLNTPVARELPLPPEVEDALEILGELGSRLERARDAA